MENIQNSTFFYYFFSMVSVCAFVLSIVFLVVGLTRKSGLHKGNTFARFMITFLIAIWAFRFEHIVFLSGCQGSDMYGMNILEQFAYSFFYTFMTFGFDEANLGMWIGMNTMFEEVFGNGLTADAFSLYVSLFYIVAPVAGGALIINILYSFFPTLKIRMQFLRDKYIFSELNNNSLELAASTREYHGNRASIIFAGVSHEGGDSEMAELRAAARNIGAICLKDSVTDISVFGSAPVNYVLMGRGDQNFNYMTEFIDEDSSHAASGSIRHYERVCSKSIRRGSGIEILVFDNRDYVGEMVSKLYSPENEAKYRLKTNNTAVIVINERLKVVRNLLLKVPLYSAIKDDEGKVIDDRVSILIVGCGDMGEAFLRTAFWMGQFGLRTGDRSFDKVKLEINIVDKDARSIKNKLELKYPGICFDGENDYCRFRFYTQNVHESEFYNLLGSDELKDVNYIFTCLDDDMSNFRVAENIRHKLDLVDISRKKTRQYAFFIVKDRSVAKIIRNTKTSDNVHVLGGYEHQSWDSVFSHDSERKMLETISASHDDLSLFSHLIDQYMRRADQAQALHYKYRLFSLGLDTEHEKWSKKYRKAALQTVRNNIDFLAWQEHMRWNAFVLSSGYAPIKASEFHKYLVDDETGRASTKNSELKLHSMITSSAMGLNEQLSDYAAAVKNAGDFAEACALIEGFGCDELDRTSLEIYALQLDAARLSSNKRKKIEFKDYKAYDYSTVENFMKFIARGQMEITDEI